MLSCVVNSAGASQLTFSSGRLVIETKLEYIKSSSLAGK